MRGWRVADSGGRFGREVRGGLARDSDAPSGFIRAVGFLMMRPCSSGVRCSKPRAEFPTWRRDLNYAGACESWADWPWPTPPWPPRRAISSGETGLRDFFRRRFAPLANDPADGEEEFLVIDRLLEESHGAGG